MLFLFLTVVFNVACFCLALLVVTSFLLFCFRVLALLFELLFFLFVSCFVIFVLLSYKPSVFRSLMNDWTDAWSLCLSNASSLLKTIGLTASFQMQTSLPNTAVETSFQFVEISEKMQKKQEHYEIIFPHAVWPNWAILAKLGWYFLTHRCSIGLVCNNLGNSFCNRDSFGLLCWKRNSTKLRKFWFTEICSKILIMQ